MRAPGPQKFKPWYRNPFLRLLRFLWQMGLGRARGRRARSSRAPTSGPGKVRWDLGPRGVSNGATATSPWGDPRAGSPALQFNATRRLRGMGFGVKDRAPLLRLLRFLWRMGLGSSRGRRARSSRAPTSGPGTARGDAGPPKMPGEGTRPTERFPNNFSPIINNLRRGGNRGRSACSLRGGRSGRAGWFRRGRSCHHACGLGRGPNPPVP